MALSAAECETLIKTLRSGDPGTTFEFNSRTWTRVRLGRLVAAQSGPFTICQQNPWKGSVWAEKARAGSDIFWLWRQAAGARKWLAVIENNSYRQLPVSPAL